MSDTLKLLLGAIIGVLVGLYLHHLGTTAQLTQNIIYVCGLISSIFIGLLKMVMVPLVFSSIAIGVAQLSIDHNAKKTGLITLSFFTLTTSIATIIGLVGMQVFQPGVGLDKALFQEQMVNFDTNKLGLGEFMNQFVKGLFVNPVSAMADGNIMAVVIFALFVGVLLVKGGSQFNQLKTLIDQLYQLVMAMVTVIMKLAPIGIAALLAKMIATQDLHMISLLIKFMAVVIGMTLFHGLVILPTLLYVLGKYSPLQFFKNARPALAMAFASSSSAATLPVTINTLNTNFKAPPSISNFVAPLGAQINMDGTAMYEAAAALFIAQLMGFDLSLGQQIVVVMMAMLASIGAPGMPSAGMVTMVMVLQSVGLPVEAIAILLPIDRILDAFRTTVNVEGDMITTLVVSKLTGSRTAS